MNGPAKRAFEQTLQTIYATDYQTLRRNFTNKIKQQGRRVRDVVPDLKKETLRKVFSEEAAQAYLNAAMIEYRQVTAPMRVTIIFNQNTTQYENGRIFVNVPAILEQVQTQYPALVLGLDRLFKNWINATRLANIEVPPNRVMFIMRRNISADGMNEVVWSAWRNNDGTYNISSRSAQRFFWLDYLSGISRGLTHVIDPYELIIDFVAPKRDNPHFVQVGYDYTMAPGEKNCLVRILEPFVPQPVNDKFKEMTDHLIHKQDAPAYIDDSFIDRLGKLLRVKISLYTPYGALHDTPTKILGSGGNKKNFKLIVNNRHATVFAPTVVNKVNYIDSPADYIAVAGSPNVSTVIEMSDPFVYPIIENTPWAYNAYLHPENETSKRNISAFITVDGFGRNEATTTMNKFLRPSAITGIPEDDQNPALFNKTNPSGVFLYNFIRKNNFTVPPRFVHELACKAGRPFGTAEMKITKDRTRLIEIDQNASYASFEFSKFYEGMPVGNWMKIAGPPKELPDPELRPAFIEVVNIKPKKLPIEDVSEGTKQSNMKFNALVYDYFEALGQLRSDFSVITYPEYKAWSAIADIDVVNTTYATFQRIGIYDDLNDLSNRMRVALQTNQESATLVESTIAAYVKRMRNAFTGKLIQGGLDSYGAIKTIVTRSREEFEIMIAEHERDFGELPPTEIITDEINESTLYKITTTVRKPGHRFPHIYAYITALSRLSVLGMLSTLKTNHHAVARVHVDAIYVRVPSKYRDEQYANIIKQTIGGIGANPGQFKVEPVHKKYNQKEITKSSFNIFDGQFYAIFSHAQPAAEGYPGHRKVVVTGPGGTGKTHVAVNFLSDNNGRALYLTPTKELRGELRDKLDDIGKQPSDCVCLESVRRAIVGLREARERGRVPPPEYIGRLSEIAAKYTYIIIDEFCKTDGAHLQEIIAFAEQYRKNIIMMGDFNQTIFSLSGVYATRQKLTEWGFHMFVDPRNARAPGKPMRHDYTWGTFLDSIAGLDSEVQVQRLIDYGIQTITEDAPLNPAALVYCGTWSKIAQYNGALLANDTAARLAIIGKKETIPYDQGLKSKVWNKQAFAEPQPRGMKYSVDFAITVDSVQGSTVENPIQYIHVASLINRWGAIYTAATRSRTPQQIVLII